MKTSGLMTLRSGRQATYYRLRNLEEQGIAQIDRLPFTIRILLENLLRSHAAGRVAWDEVVRLARWKPAADPQEIPFMPARVLLQDFTGVPAVVDLAAMRSALRRLGGDPSRVNPLVPADLVIDHSVQVDFYGDQKALEENVALEYQRNRERYGLLKWAQKAFSNFRVVPPAQGICHQVNLESLATVVRLDTREAETLAFPDTLVGTDSHTTMINGLGVLGWGVGGIEAEAVLLGQPYYMLVPEVLGVRLRGKLPDGATATDLVLTVTETLRRQGVVGRLVEFFGPGLTALSLPDRATVANMSPEFGATAAFFPVDGETIEYLRLTGRDEERIRLVESYARAQLLCYRPDTPEPVYSDLLELDMARIEPCLAGPRRPQDRIPVDRMKDRFRADLQEVYGRSLAAEPPSAPATQDAAPAAGLRHGSVVIAAITSCTNTSNPSVMIGAGLLAEKAARRGLRVPPHVKTSLAPGSRVVADYLRASGLLGSLEALGFHVAGYGCTTCIGNSGPLAEEVGRAVRDEDLVVAAVLSGNRNFEARIHPQVRANYLASPMLVVAYALAGRIDIDLRREPLGADGQGRPVYLREIWPDPRAIGNAVHGSIRKDMFLKRYGDIWLGDARWQELAAPQGEIYEWDPDSTYILEPSFFLDMPRHPAPLEDIDGARVLAFMGDSVTTDHISPAGSIPASTPAGRYLIARGIRPEDFNSYGSRRGNHEVMVRGTFANIRIRNLLVPGQEGGWTRHFPSQEVLPIYEAAMKYRRDLVPLIVLAGREYGTGSSRDWAAKGTRLLGVRAVLAESFERIHRSNLVGMGVLPLQLPAGQTATSLGLTGAEVFRVRGLAQGLAPAKALEVTAQPQHGPPRSFRALARLDTPVEVEYYRNGGILQVVLRALLR
ncbi:MAG: aconitate hydratase AcnA [bacterium]